MTKKKFKVTAEGKKVPVGAIAKSTAAASKSKAKDTGKKASGSANGGS